MVNLLLGIRFESRAIALASGDNVVRAQVERPQDIEGDFTVEAKTLEADRCDFIAVLIQCADLKGNI